MRNKKLRFVRGELARSGFHPRKPRKLIKLQFFRAVTTCCDFCLFSCTLQDGPILIESGMICYIDFTKSNSLIYADWDCILLSGLVVLVDIVYACWVIFVEWYRYVYTFLIMDQHLRHPWFPCLLRRKKGIIQGLICYIPFVEYRTRKLTSSITKKSNSGTLSFPTPLFALLEAVRAWFAVPGRCVCWAARFAPWRTAFPLAWMPLRMATINADQVMFCGSRSGDVGGEDRREELSSLPFRTQE